MAMQMHTHIVEISKQRRKQTNRRRLSPDDEEKIR
jgi:hypothetical protein